MQEIIVLIIGIVVFGYVGWKAYTTVTRKPKPGDRCAGCNGCDLKENLNCKEK